VPPPQNFSRPKSGTGRKVKIEMPKRPASKKHPEVSSSSSEPDDAFLSGQEEDDSDEEIEKMTGLYKYQPRKNFYKKSHQRGYNPGYAKVKVCRPID
jgi:hypothetical protein